MGIHNEKQMITESLRVRKNGPRGPAWAEEA